MRTGGATRDRQTTERRLRTRNDRYQLPAARLAAPNAYSMCTRARVRSPARLVLVQHVRFTSRSVAAVARRVGSARAHARTTQPWPPAKSVGVSCVSVRGVDRIGWDGLDDGGDVTVFVGGGGGGVYDGMVVVVVVRLRAWPVRESAASAAVTPAGFVNG